LLWTAREALFQQNILCTEISSQMFYTLLKEDRTYANENLG